MKPRLSVARSITFTGLVLSTLHQLSLLLLLTGFATLVSGLAGGDTKTIAITVFTVIDLALLLPVWRGRKWALPLALVMMALLLRSGGPFMLAALGHPQQFLPWTWNLMALAGMIAGLCFGVVACLEAFGKLAPAGLQDRQGGVAKALGWAFAGMLALGAGLSLAPAPQGAMAQAPDDVVQMTLEHLKFMPDQLELDAGKRTAIFLINHDTVDHSFRVEALNIEVSVPAGGSAVAMVKPDAAGDLQFYCNVPGHKAAGMTGILHVRG